MRPGFGKLFFSVTHAFNVSHTPRPVYELPQLLSFPNSRLSQCQSNFGNVTVSPSARRYGHPSPKPQDSQPKPNNAETSHGRKRKGKNSLRRVAVEAQRSRDSKSSETSPVSPIQATTKYVMALCAAEEYDIDHAARILDPLGKKQDPYRTNLYPQVIHIEMPLDSPHSTDENGVQTKGDLFIFPSGTVVGWAIPESTLYTLVSKTLLPASQRPHLKQLEEEDFNFIEDPKREYSSIKGDNIILGTKTTSFPSNNTVDSQNETRNSIRNTETENTINQNHKRDAVLAKIVFSSGLAKSTKLAVLESQLNNYFDTTKSMLDILARGGRLWGSRSFVLSKTGQLLNIRAQLNLYSELTDSLPDVFWDSRSELGLEGYYDQVGKALDTNIRVKELNEKMNYAQEIADVLRETLSERHGTRLEWIIIILIAVEICFNVLHEWRFYMEGEDPGEKRSKKEEIHS